MRNSFSPPVTGKPPQQPARDARSHSVSIGRMAAPEHLSGARPSYALPYPFPDGGVWAAIRHGVVTNMAYMTPPDGVHFGTFRQRERGRLARDGEVWSGEVKGGRFWPSFASSDVRRGGNMNTAREVR